MVVVDEKFSRFAGSEEMESVGGGDIDNVGDDVPEELEEDEEDEEEEDSEEVELREGELSGRISFVVQSSTNSSIETGGFAGYGGTIKSGKIGSGM